MLFREWTLFESIKYSDYVCTRMKLWTEAGNLNLLHLFTKLGIPKEHYN